MNVEAIAEVQGWYGPVSISERVVQRIWRDGDFARDRLQLENGAPVEILDPGRWNHHEGPDFIDAELRIDGKRVVGSVEVHIYERDWNQHGHGSDPRYNTVALHVVLFRPPAIERRPVLCQDGHEPECLCLLDHLDKDLEAYAAEQALQQLTDPNGSDLRDWMLAQEWGRRLERCREGARARWRQKQAFALQRLKTLGWEQACHQTTLEVLGYRRNRAVMSDLAQYLSIDDMAGRDVDALMALGQDRWRLSGQRPNNHPRKRLEQYLALLRANRRWPEVLLRWAKGLPSNAQMATEPTRRVRHQFAFSAARESLSRHVLEGVLSGPRLDTLVVDAILPLAAAYTRESELYGWWYHWSGGDIPESVNEFLKQIGIYTNTQPVCNGLNQGALELLIRDGSS